MRDVVKQTSRCIAKRSCSAPALLPTARHLCASPPPPPLHPPTHPPTFAPPSVCTHKPLHLVTVGGAHRRPGSQLPLCNGPFPHACTRPPRTGPTDPVAPTQPHPDTHSSYPGALAHAPPPPPSPLPAARVHLFVDPRPRAAAGRAGGDQPAQPGRPEPQVGQARRRPAVLYSAVQHTTQGSATAFCCACCRVLCCCLLWNVACGVVCGGGGGG